MTKDETSCYGCKFLGHVKKGVLRADFYCTFDFGIVGYIRKETGIKHPKRRSKCNFQPSANPRLLSKSIVVTVLNKTERE